MGLLQDIEKRRRREKLGRKPTKKKPGGKGAWTAADFDKMAELTHFNNHTEARIFVARKMGYRDLCVMLEGLNEIHIAADLGGKGFKVTDAEREAVLDLSYKIGQVVMAKVRAKDAKLAERINENL